LQSRLVFARERQILPLCKLIRCSAKNKHQELGRAPYPGH
jgi:hypothetical protein